MSSLQDLLQVKAVTSYFLQACWRRSTKTGARIDLDKRFTCGGTILQLAARQKAGKSYLFCGNFADRELTRHVYLEVLDVIALDAGVGKLIHLVSPQVVEAEELYAREYDTPY